MNYQPKFGSVRADKILMAISWASMAFITYGYAELYLQHPSWTIIMIIPVLGYLYFMFIMIIKRHGVFWKWK